MTTQSVCLPCKAAGRNKTAPQRRTVCFRCVVAINNRLTVIERAVFTIIPTTGSGGRRAPGFGSRSPAWDDVIAACDPRSRSWDWDEKGDDNDTSIRSVAAALCGIADGIVEESGRTRPTGPRTVRTECAYIRDTENVWSFSQGVADIADELYELESMVKRLTGEHRPKKIGECPSLLDTGDECGTPLFAPVFGDTIKCRGCRREWARAEWLRLGTLLNLDDVA